MRGYEYVLQVRWNEVRIKDEGCDFQGFRDARDEGGHGLVGGSRL